MSKTIGNMTLKATPVGTDAVAIADSEDSDKTKKILLSALGGGGADKIHIVENVTWSNPNYSGTASDVTQYEDGHLYIIQFPSISGTIADIRYININSLGDIQLDYNYENVWSSSKTNILPKYPETSIVVYRSTQNMFYFIGSTNKTLAEVSRAQEMWASNHMYIKTESVDQYAVAITSTTPTIYVPGGSNYDRYHVLNICTNPLTSLTISIGNVTSTWETEIQFTTDSTFTFTAAGLVGKWIGGTPTFSPNTSYVISIKNGLAACGEVS